MICSNTQWTVLSHENMIDIRRETRQWASRHCPCEIWDVTTNQHLSRPTTTSNQNSACASVSTNQHLSRPTTTSNQNSACASVSTNQHLSRPTTTSNHNSACASVSTNQHLSRPTTTSNHNSACASVSTNQHLSRPTTTSNQNSVCHQCQPINTFHDLQPHPIRTQRVHQCQRSVEHRTIVLT